MCAIIESYEENQVPVQKVWHTYTDHLGSLVYLENADNSNETLEYSYDCWGNPRKVSDWLDPSPIDELIADRGYTGHEHLTEFGLINMNGRVYDPKLGRFLSPDPFVQAPHTVGGFNRYTYCFNNPLKYTDPSGYMADPYWIGGFEGAYASGQALFYQDSGPNRSGGRVDGTYQGIWRKMGAGASKDGPDGKDYDEWRKIAADNGSPISFMDYWKLTSKAGNLVVTGLMDYYEVKVDDEGEFIEDPRYMYTKITYGSPIDNLSIDDIGNFSSYASGTIGLYQIGMLKYRMSLPLSSKIGTFGRFSSQYGTLGKIGGRLGYAGAGISLISDINEFRSEEIGAGRFTYRLGSLGTSIAVGAAIGGPWGFVGGAAFGGISVGFEYIYDNIMVPLGNEIQYHIWNFENAIEDGWYPGR